MRRANNSFGVQGYAPVRRRGRSNAMGTSSGYAPSALFTQQDEDDEVLATQPGDTAYQAAQTEAYNAGSPGAVGTVTEPYNADSPGAVGEGTEPYRMSGGQPVEDQPRQTTLPGRSPGHILPDGTIEYDEQPMQTAEPYRPRGGMRLPDGTFIGDEEPGPGHFEQYEAGAANNWQEAGNENALYSMRDTEAEGDPNEFLPTDDATAAHEADPPPVQADDTNLLSPEDIAANRTSGRSLDSLGPRGIGPRTVNEIPRGNQTIFNQSDDEYAAQSIREQGDQDAGAIDALISEIEAGPTGPPPPIERDKYEGMSDEDIATTKRIEANRDQFEFEEEQRENQNKIKGGLHTENMDDATGIAGSAGYRDGRAGLSGELSNRVDENERLRADQQHKASNPGQNAKFGRNGAIELPPEEGSMGMTSRGRELPIVGSRSNPDWTPWNGEPKYIPLYKDTEARTPEQIREDQQAENDAKRESIAERTWYVDPETGYASQQREDDDQQKVIVPRDRENSPLGAENTFRRKQDARQKRADDAAAKTKDIEKFRADKAKKIERKQQSDYFAALSQARANGQISSSDYRTALNYLASLGGTAPGTPAAPGTPNTPGTPAAPGTPNTPGTSTPQSTATITRSNSRPGRVGVGGNYQPEMVTDENDEQFDTMTEDQQEANKNWINDKINNDRFASLIATSETAIEDFNDTNATPIALLGNLDNRITMRKNLDRLGPAAQKRAALTLFDRLSMSMLNHSGSNSSIIFDSSRKNIADQLGANLSGRFMNMFDGSRRSPQEKLNFVFSILPQQRPSAPSIPSYPGSYPYRMH